MTPCLLSCPPVTFLKGDLPRGRGSKFFPFREDALSEGKQNNFDRVASPESLFIPLKASCI